MKYEIAIKDLPECIVYYKRGEIATFDDISEFVLKSAEECRVANPNIQCTDDGYCFVAFMERPIDGKPVKIEYAQSVKTMGKETDNIKFRKLKSTSAVCVKHKGPYEEMGKAYEKLVLWMLDQGLRASEPPREYYIKGPWDCGNKHEWITEIEIPIDHTWIAKNDAVQK